MRTLCFAVLLALPASASAFSSRQTGLAVGAAGGLAVSGPPTHAGVGWQASVGVWHGIYDDAFFLGRYQAGAIALRQDLAGDALLTHVGVEYRRGMDLAILGVHGFAEAGPDFAPGAVGVSARLGVQVKYRPRPKPGPFIRLEGGAAYLDGKVSPRVGAMAGFEFAFPTSRSQPAG